MSKLPPRDPIAAYQRKVKAERRIGPGKKCACGEDRPEALIEGSDPTICAECRRKKRGQTTMDNHHPAGAANSPDTMPVPVNDHRAELSVAQADWPKETLQNRDRCPLLRGGACVRGVIDYLHYLINKFLLWIPEMLEELSAFLKKALGPAWWVGTLLERFAPEG